MADSIAPPRPQDAPETVVHIVTRDGRLAVNKVLV
jgi:hypothetical protein